MKIFTAAQIRELDKYTIESEPIRSIDLMERAAKALTRAITEVWPTQTPVVVFAGPGNNGGDALAVARLLSQQDYQVEVYLFNITGSLSPDCMTNKHRLQDVKRVKLTEVTQELWGALMGPVTLGTYWGHPQWPVTSVTWYQIETFISKLNELTGENFRLPTEAEWEFAARGGNYSMGYMHSGGLLTDVAWCSSTAGGRPHPVGLLLPNELGLYDMSGNVFECCQDYYGSYSSEPQTDPTGPETGYSHVARGGSWDGSVYSTCRVSYRTKAYTGADCGLRLALSE